MPRTFTDTEKPQERAFLVFVNPDDEEDEYVERELEGLCLAAGVGVAGSIRQRIDHPTRATYLGSGKVEELRVGVLDTGADLVVVDTELSGTQNSKLSEALDRRVLDRTQLILDIFAQRAHTREGQLQVELAQLLYMLPRLMSVYTKFERQRGGIGMRGPGEMKLEADRRVVKDRIARLEDDIRDVQRQRGQQRSSRRKTPFPFAAIVGYTSAGKSTLMNRLCGTELLADAMPFATLDATTRKVDLADGYSLFITDTVGFIRNLPTHLVAAFRSTLEEVTEADFVLHVVDVSIDAWEMQRDAVLETLESLGAGDKPCLTVFNKIDRLPPDAPIDELVASWAPAVGISATTGANCDGLLLAATNMVRTFLAPVRVIVPYAESGLVDECYRFGRVLTTEYRDEGIYIEAELVADMRGRMAPYALEA